MKATIIVFAIIAALVLAYWRTTSNDTAEHTQMLRTIAQENEKSIQNPEIIGHNDYGTIARVKIKVCDECLQPTTHYIYMVNGVKSDNYKVQMGKTTQDAVDVMMSKNVMK